MAGVTYGACLVGFAPVIHPHVECRASYGASFIKCGVLREFIRISHYIGLKATVKAILSRHSTEHSDVYIAVDRQCK